MTSKFTKLNQFIVGNNGVYAAPGQQQREFAYSDGQEVEHRLRWIFNTVNDLSSTSYELQDHITDWPSEYHLTPVRANLLRALNLEGVENVLELGCGCGSITRYLGEQKKGEQKKVEQKRGEQKKGEQKTGEQENVQVDAVEGSPVRAELAALRCRDLPNVTVSTANFNDVDFPEGHYDLVLFVGVTEYAGRFSDAATDEEALQDLLALAKRAAKPDGVVLVAIENRTGMKYVVGANEDHYAKPYIGIHNYAQPAGIRTYTYKEWQQQISDAAFAHHEFLYPFPDYKIPTLFIGDDYAQQNPRAYVHLEGNRSRDYIEDFKQGSKEALLWEAAVTSKTLGDYANSFMILMSNSAQTIAELSPYDFAHLPNFKRKLEYSLHIAKSKNKQFVERRYISEKVPSETSEFSHQLIKEEPFYPGAMLSVEWSRSLISYPDLALFKQFLQHYYQYLKDNKAALSIDLLPVNLVVSGDVGQWQYQAIDEEWQLGESWQAKLTPEFIFYRAVLLFYCQYPDFIEQKFKQQLKTIGDWVHFAFEQIEQPIDNQQLKTFFQFNDEFQRAISYQYGEVDFATPLTTTPNLMILHWRTEQGEYSADNHLRVSGKTHHGRQQLKFVLPPSNKKIKQLLLHPADNIEAELAAFFRLYSLTLSAVNASGEQRVLWQCDNAAAMQKAAKLYDLHWQSDSDPSQVTGLYVSGDDPRIEFILEQTQELQMGEHFELIVDVTYPRSRDYLLAKQSYTEKLDALSNEQMQHEQLQRRCQQQAEELASIKQSRSWQYLLKAQQGAAQGRRYLAWLPKSAKLIQQLIQQKGFSGFFKHGQQRLGQTLGQKLGTSTPEKTTSPFEHWLTQRPANYWSSAVTLDHPMSLTLLLIEQNNDLTAWERLLHSIEKQLYWSAINTEQASCLQLHLHLCCSNQQIATLAQTILAQHSSIRISYSVQAESEPLEELAKLDAGDNTYRAWLTNNDYLAPQYLGELTKCLETKKSAVIYTDEVRLPSNDEQSLEEPYFKPSYSPDLLANMNYLGRHCWVHSQAFIEHLQNGSGQSDSKQSESGKSKSEQTWHQLIAKLCSKPSKHASGVAHIQKPIVYLASHEFGQHKITPPVLHQAETPELVSIIIPFKDKPALLARCLDALLEKTTYSNIEIIGVSNDSLSAATYETMDEYAKKDKRIRFYENNTRFNFAKLINYGVTLSQGEHIVLLNNDIELISADWCEQMLHYSRRDDVAAVGAKLFYPDGRIQHAGIALNVGSMAAHVNKLSPGNESGYFNRLDTVNNVMAVTGAMMMVKKQLFTELGGLDETRFAVAFNDIDFCLRAWQKGLLNVFTPYAQAKHIESVSRGYEDDVHKLQRFEIEQAHFQQEYQYLLAKGDAYYNVNLRRDREDYYWKLD